MKLVAALTVLLLLLSCQGQVFSDHEEGIGDVVHMIKLTLDVLYEQKEKMISLDEHLKKLTASQEEQKEKMISLEEHLKNLTASQEDQNQQIRDDFSSQNQQIRDDLSVQNMKIVSLEEQLMVSSASHEETLRAGLQNMTENFLNSSAIEHNELLPSLQKCSGFLDFIENQNECIDGSHRCSEFAQCIDEGLNYKCQCHKGFLGNGFQCHDIDECKEGNPCHPEAECHNLMGNYTCTCNQPYVGDGHTCEFNCQDSFGGELVEDLGCLTLVKIKMTWEASKKHCEAKGMKLMEDIPSKQHFRLIWNDFKTQAGMWVLAKGRRWLTTGEDIASNLYYKDQPDGRSSECIYLNSRREADEWEGLADYSCTRYLYSLCQFLLPSQ